MTEEMKKELAEIKAEEQKTEVDNLPAKQDQSLGVGEVINNQVQQLFTVAVQNNKEGVKALTEKAVQTEIEIKTEEVEGRKEVEKSKIRKNVTKAKTEEDEAKHERSQTILKSQGFTSKLPAPYRITALILGYPIFFIYTITLGAVVSFLTFAVKGFITMVADCAERFADVNKKFISNGNEKDFKLGKAMIGILKWVLIVGAILAVVILLVVK